MRSAYSLKKQMHVETVNSKVSHKMFSFYALYCYKMDWATDYRNCSFLLDPRQVRHSLQVSQSMYLPYFPHTNTNIIRCQNSKGLHIDWFNFSFIIWRGNWGSEVREGVGQKLQCRLIGELRQELKSPDSRPSECSVHYITWPWYCYPLNHL